MTAQQYADYSSLRLRLAELREHLDQIRHDVYWDDRLGRSCEHLNRALEHIKAARDHTHDWEYRPHPILDQPCASISSTSNDSSSISLVETKST